MSTCFYDFLSLSEEEEITKKVVQGKIKREGAGGEVVSGANLLFIKKPTERAVFFSPTIDLETKMDFRISCYYYW